MDWTPRTNGKALAGTYHYIISGEDGVREVVASAEKPDAGFYAECPQRHTSVVR